jgi:outer membrane biosynthesis protein TonB
MCDKLGSSPQSHQVNPDAANHPPPDPGESASCLGSTQAGQTGPATLCPDSPETALQTWVLTRLRYPALGTCRR